MKSLVLCFFLFGVLSSTAHAYVTEEDANTEKNNPDPYYAGGITIATGEVTFRQTGDMSGCPKRPWTAEQTAAREKSIEVTFDVTFYKPPSVSVWLTTLDSRYDQNIRYTISVSDVTTTGCVIYFKTWCSTYVHRTIVAYQAIGVSP